MIRFAAGEAQVPVQLEPLMDDHIRSVQERWQNAHFENVVPIVPTLTPVDIGGENVRIARLRPLGEIDDESVIALSFPYQQPLNKTMVMRAAFMQQAIAPNTEVLLFPNVHTGKDQTYVLSDSDKQRLSEGLLAPLGEKYARAITKLGIPRIALTGYSMGGSTSIEIAASGLPNTKITHVNADEAPSKHGRTAKQLQKDFLQSGGYGMQRKSMAESGFGSLMRRYAGPRLLVDYAQFGIHSLGEVSKLIHQGMTDTHYESILEAHWNHPEAAIKIGHVAGSKLVDDSDFKNLEYNNDIRVAYYTGSAANAHTTGDNYVAHALMVKDGLNS